MISRNKRLHLFILVCSCYSAVISQGPSCTDHVSVVGPDNPRDYNDDLDKDQGFGYVMYGDPYVVDCCGTIINWEFSIGDNADIELQVWRPSGITNEEFQLVGLNMFEVTRKDRRVGYISYDVESDKLISVEKGDVIGWYAPGDSLVEYSTGTSYDGIWKIQHDASVTVGQVVDFSDGMRQQDRTYGIQATLAPNRAPAFNLSTISIRMDAEVGSTVYVISVKDPDPADVNSLVVDMTSQQEFFAFDPSTNILSVATAMTVPDAGKTFDILFKLTDHCGAETIGSLRVVVKYVDSQDPNSSTEKVTGPAKVTSDDKDFTTTSTTSMTSTDFLDETTSNDDTITEAKPETGSRAALIGGIVAAIILVIIVIIVVIYLIKKKSMSKTAPPKDAEKGQKKLPDPTQKPTSSKA